jgi:hypothetical protein
VTKILLIALLTLTVHAQVRTVEAVRVAVIATGDESAELRREVVRELQKLRNVAIVTGGADFRIQLTGAPFKGECVGVVVAVLTTTPNGSELQAFAGGTWQEVAKGIASQLKEDFKVYGFTRRKMR